MQQIPLILASLAALIAGMLVLRRLWYTIRLPVRRALVATAVGAIALLLFAYATHWTTTSDRLNFGIYWMAVAGYLLLLMRHSLTRPRWLSATSAVILATPIFASSLLLPLGGIFHPPPRRIVPLGSNLYASWQAFSDLSTTPTGDDVEIFYSPRFLPLLRHTRLGGRFYNLRCDAASTEMVLQPDRRTVFVRCPPWPGAAATSRGEYLQLH